MSSRYDGLWHEARWQERQDAERRERDARIMRRTTVILLRSAARLEKLAEYWRANPLGAEYAEEAAVVRKLEREVRRLAERLEEEE